MYKFENLAIWRDSMLLVKDIYILIGKLPAKERSNISDQLRRASTSIALNIAEGSASQNDVEFKRYLFISKKSLFEVISILRLIKMIYNVENKNIEDRIERLVKQITSFIKIL